MSNARDSLEWVSHDEAREILALLEGVEKLILVGGQAVSFWAEFYAGGTVRGIRVCRIQGDTLASDCGGDGAQARTVFKSYGTNTHCRL